MPHRSASGARAMREALRRAKRHANNPDAVHRTYTALDAALTIPGSREAALEVLAEFLTALFEGIIINPDTWEDADPAQTKAAE